MEIIGNLFDTGKEIFKIDKPIRLIELFAGIGSQAKALENLGVDFQHWRICEFDKYAVKSYNAVHGTEFSTSDITKITAEDLAIKDTDKYCYILTYSFPCTDLSVAGKMLGMAEGSGTRSSLLWQVQRLLNECDELPQVLLMENVPQVHSEQNMPHFKKWLSYLEKLGYCNYWDDLNAKHYGVAQNRNRTFCVSLLGNYTYHFPKPIGCNLTVRDYLEDEVDEKYYLTNDKAKELIDKLVVDGKIKGEIKTGVDLCSNNSELINDNSSCIKARYDSGIVNHSCDNTGVIESESILLDYSMSGLEDGIPRVYKNECPTITSRLYKDPYQIVECNYVTMLQTVKVRKYEVDIPSLQKCLAEHKNMSCKKIAWELDVPATKIEHYFRTDNGFSIPDPDIWFKLKELLHINTDEFDESIMTFIEKESNYDMLNRVYLPDKFAPTIKCLNDGEKFVEVKVLGNYMQSEHDASRVVSKNGIAPTVKENHGAVTGVIDINLLGQMDNTKDNTHESANRVYSPDGLCPTIPTMAGGGHEPKFVHIRQATEEGVVPCLIGGVADLNYTGSQTRRGRVQDNGLTCPALATINQPSVIEKWLWMIDGEWYRIRIRKLIPLECWLLMGFDRESFFRAEKVNSNAQLYKQAGNSIVVDVLEDIFKEML